MFRHFLRPILFALSPEQAHLVVIWLLRIVGWIPGGRWLLGRCCAVEDPRLEREVFGVKFRNPIGVAAGIDRSGEVVDELGAMGFGFVEVGTLTPNGQSGNPMPRLFRDRAKRHIYHRVGHANRGLKSAIRHLRGQHCGVVVGCNLGCNASTPPAQAPKDVLKLFRNLYQYADYFVVNICGDDVRDTVISHSETYINALLEPLFDFRRGQNQYRPIFLKIAADFTDEEVDRVVDILIRTPLDGIVAADGALLGKEPTQSDYAGCRRSGSGLAARTIELVRRIHTRSGGTYPIIGTGGMMTAEEIQAMFEAGADLVQLCSGLIYEGPQLLKTACHALLPAPQEQLTEAVEQPQTHTTNEEGA